MQDLFAVQDLFARELANYEIRRRVPLDRRLTASTGVVRFLV
ncbi:hypothetical protein [Streptomyces sp. TRM72054]|nr:hypothetical protein [Streptomyces sp. TRM72054]